MIKDIVLHLSADAKHNVAAKYAVSVAEAFGPNLAAVTFAYEALQCASITTVSCVETNLRRASSCTWCCYGLDGLSRRLEARRRPHPIADPLECGQYQCQYNQ